MGLPNPVPSTLAKIIKKTIVHVAVVVLRLDAGGMERYIANVANGLPRDNFKISIICLDQMGTARAWFDTSNVDVIELRILKGNSLRSIRVIANALEHLKPDIVHSHNWATLVESYLAVRRYGSCVHLHGERGTVLGTNACGPLKLRLRALVMRWICRRIAVTTNSHCVAAKIEAITKIDASQIHVVPNGLDSKHSPAQRREFRTLVRQELGFANDDYVIGTVARLSRIKNLGLAIRSLADAQASLERKGHLLFVGDGPCRDELEQLADSKGLSDCVHFVGHQWHTWRYLAAMDVYVNCSDSEGMSQSMLEAMASELAVIATDVGDASIMLAPPDPCGIVIAPNNQRELVDAMIKMNDLELRDSYGLAALARQRGTYTLARMLEGYAQLYRQLANVSRS
ncbi:glycosyltransferase [Stieleria sp. ICT_E10.1]|uniref:glycosyltransferase n=1 Tax=Stieleria sedimenti TaxID=2976331 RepID=UPI0021804F15|nr:glycosyltransferase [Stieleria sedimenti]MCS7466768.1 glycosyltransferase [Stieleria sedimenti]